MSKRILLFLFILLGYNTYTIAQTTTCGSDAVNAALMTNNPAFAREMQAKALKWAQASAVANNALVVNTANGPVYEIPVVVHVMHTGVPVGNINNPTDATIITYIDFLNKTYSAQWSFYNDTNNGGVRVPIKFVLAKRTPVCGGGATTGINRVNVSTIYPIYTNNGISTGAGSGVPDSVLKSLSIWPSNEYYNIWMVNYIDGPSGGIGGYAYFPGTPTWIDGTVILAQYATPYSNGSYYYAVPHELGHAFGLLHTFQGGGTSTCPSNSNCATSGDEVCDTEPHINLNNGVCASGTNTCTGLPYAGVQYNFMNYTACPARFTPGQRTKALFNLTNYRAGLINSLGTTLPAAFTPPTAAACIPGIINPGNEYDMGPHEIQVADLSVSGSGYTNDGYKVYIDKTCTQGAAHVTAGGSYNISINTYNNRQNVGVWIDYNNDGTFQATEQVMSHNNTNTALNDETHTGTFTVPTTGVITCTPLRMRIMADFYPAPAPQPCVNLYYGQAEDYSIYVSPATTTPTVAITAAPTGAVCANASVTFTGTITNIVSPTYQWKKNGVSVGSNANTYTNNAWVNNDIVTLEVTGASGCTSTSTTTTSNSITMSVTPNATPSVSVITNTGTTICAGTTVTFTATPVNGGTIPSYQWKKNGLPVGLNQATYTDNALANSDAITVVLTSNAACAAPATATSTALNMVVNPTVVPSVTVTPNTGSTICNGTNVTFTASPTNGGTIPSYQWKKNGGNVGSNQATYSDNTLANSDVISVVLTSNANCASPATATNAVTMTVNSTVVPSVVIAANPGNTICNGTSVTFTATPTNGGTAPTYQWKKNTIVVGSGASYTSASLITGDVITAVLTSNATCASPLTATSNAVTMSVGTTVIPSVAITANPGTAICPGNTVTFTAAPTNGGTAPSYQWKKNGVNIGSNQNTFTSTTLANSDVITVVLTSNLACAVPASATSNPLTMNVGTAVTPSVSVTANTGNTICAGTLVTFTATPVNGGTAPVYQWKNNGVNVGTGGTSYGPVAVANGDVITATLTSNVACATSATATSANLTMTVNPVVTPSVSIVASPATSICSGTTVTFNATPVSGGITPVYQWLLNGVNTGSNAPTYSGNTFANGDVVSIRLTSNATCTSTTPVTSNSITLAVGISLVPSVTITVSPDDTICAGTAVTFTATPVNGGTTPLYTWKRNGTTVLTNNPVYTQATTNNGDIISLQMISNATCATTTSVLANIITMRVNTLPNPVITKTGQVLNAGAGFATYKWYYNGTILTGRTSDTLHVSQNGNYTVTVTDSKGCTNTSTAFIYSTVSINTVGNGSDEVTFYPNPSRGMVYFQSTLGALNVSIFTMEGKLVMQHTETTKVDISHLADGMYTIQIRDKKGSLLKTAKLTKAAY